MLTETTPATQTPRATSAEDLHARLVKILDGGPGAIEERLREIDEASANATQPTMTSAIIAVAWRLTTMSCLSAGARRRNTT